MGICNYPDPPAPRRCTSTYAGMRCTEPTGHLPAGVPHAHEEWRWNSRMQWTQPEMIK